MRSSRPGGKSIWCWQAGQRTELWRHRWLAGGPARGLSLGSSGSGRQALWNGIFMSATQESTVGAASKPPPKPQKLHPYPFWSPRFWHGMRFGDWIKLLIEGRFRVHPTRWVMLVLISLITPFNTIMSRVQWWIYGRRIRGTELAGPPLFIIGHWRSGTTFLHELMVHDPQFTYPTTYQCFAPLHFLLTEWLLANYFGFLLPERRPMDNMQTGWQRPQEDEFALLTMGLPTPYRRMAFPNNAPVDMQYLNMEGIDRPALERWGDMLRRFVLTITYRTPRRVVLKSPSAHWSRRVVVPAVPWCPVYPYYARPVRAVRLHAAALAVAGRHSGLPAESGPASERVCV